MKNGMFLSSEYLNIMSERDIYKGGDNNGKIS
jgi:hypothetical protein